MKIKSIESQLIALFRQDEVPQVALLQKENLEAFGSIFQFRQIEPLQDVGGRPQLNFVIGRLLDKEKTINIKVLSIEERKVTITVEGTSSEADQVLEVLKAYLANITNFADESILDPLITARESVIITKLEVYPEQLLAKKYSTFINTSVTKTASSDLADAWAQLDNLSFQISYQPKDRSLEEARLTLNRKPFSITPRSGVPLSDRVFLCIAPFSTEKHIKLLEEFENLFVNGLNESE